MAGHSKWANIRHRKERQDKKKGKVWSKCSKAIMAAARAGGPDPDTNLSLRYAIDEAKYANMPKDTIQRAIDKGAGASGGEDWAEVSYEGYGPGGVAVIIDALTDNRNRTVTDLRTIFKKVGCSLATTGAVSFQFQTKGTIVLDGTYDEEKVMECALEAGAEDVQAPEEGGAWTIMTEPTAFQIVKEAIEAAGMKILEARIAKIPNETQTIRGDDARKLVAFLDALEDNDDVQNVYSNADIPSDELEKMG
jgi:YebC/PmpR family DNA-binding regulatory protein